jgi:hypothetical protein
LGEKKQNPPPQKTRLRDDRLPVFSVYCSGVTPLHAAAFSGPVRKTLQLITVFPR